MVLFNNEFTKCLASLKTKKCTAQLQNYILTINTNIKKDIRVRA